MWLLRYTRYCIHVCDTDPPCRARVYIQYIYYYTVPEGEGLLFIQFLRAKNMFIVSIETMGLKIVINQSLALHAI